MSECPLFSCEKLSDIYSRYSIGKLTEADLYYRELFSLTKLVENGILINTDHVIFDYIMRCYRYSVEEGRKFFCLYSLSGDYRVHCMWILRCLKTLGVTYLSFEDRELFDYYISNCTNLSVLVKNSDVMEIPNVSSPIQ